MSRTCCLAGKGEAALGRGQRGPCRSLGLRAFARTVLPTSRVLAAREDFSGSGGWLGGGSPPTKQASAAKGCGKRDFAWLRPAGRAALLLALCGCGGVRDDARQWWQLVKSSARRAEDHPGAEGRAALVTLCAIPPPRSVAAEDARVVRADACARVAAADLGLDNPRAALDRVKEGLALGWREDPTTAALLIVRGRAHEMLGQTVEAARAFSEAIAIDERLLEETLKGAP